MSEMKLLYHSRKKEVLAFIAILVFFLSIAIFPMFSAHAEPSQNVPNEVNTTLVDSAETYAGIFSTAVTASVNPTATLAALSVLGVIENADTYFPKVGFLVTAGDFMNKIPLIRTIGNLPIANPVAAVLLIIIAVAMFVVHSTSVSKMFSEATLDKIEQWGGFIATVSLSLLPLATTEVVAATKDINYVTATTYGITLVIALLSAIFNAIVYMCIYECINAVELIGAAIPIKGMSLIIQIAKAILHFILLILQIFSPILSVIVSFILMIIGIILFKKLSLLTTYYKFIYVKPLWKKIFHRDEHVPLVHKKFPRRGYKQFPGLTLAVPVFSSRKDKLHKLKKRELIWLIVKDEVPSIARIKAFRKIKVIPLSDLNLNNDTLYLRKSFRFTRVMTQDKQIELILSNEYENQWRQLLDQLKVEDYKIIEEEKKEARKEKSVLRKWFLGEDLEEA